MISTIQMKWSQHPVDLKASVLSDAFFNRSFLDPSVKGEFPQGLVQILKEEGIMPVIEEGDMEIIKNNTVDILGVKKVSENNGF